MKSKKDFNVGDKVFAKVKGYPPWPATVDEIKGKKYSVTFYGTKETSKLKLEDLCDYLENRDKITGKYSKKKGFLDSVRELEEELSGNNTTIREDVYKEDERLKQDDESELNNDDTENFTEDTPSATQNRKKRSLSSSQSSEDLPKAKRPAVSRKSSTASNASSQKKHDSPEHNAQYTYESPLRLEENEIEKDEQSPPPENNVNSTVNGRDYEIVFADELYEKTKYILEEMEAAHADGNISNELTNIEKTGKSRRSLFFKSYKFNNTNNNNKLLNRDLCLKDKEILAFENNSANQMINPYHNSVYKSLSSNNRNVERISIVTKTKNFNENIRAFDKKSKNMQKSTNLKYNYGIDKLLHANRQNLKDNESTTKQISKCSENTSPTNSKLSETSLKCINKSIAKNIESTKFCRINPSIQPFIPSTFSKICTRSQNIGNASSQSYIPSTFSKICTRSQKQLLNTHDASHKQVNKDLKRKTQLYDGPRRSSKRLLIKRQNSKRVRNLMNYLTSSQADFTRNKREYFVYIAQCEYGESYRKKPKYDYADETILVDESDYYSSSDDSNNNKFVQNIDFSTYLKSQTESAFQQKENYYEADIEGKYRFLNGMNDMIDHDNRHIRLCENRGSPRKRNKFGIILSEPVDSPNNQFTNQMTHEELLTLHEIDLISFLSLCGHYNRHEQQKHEYEPKKNRILLQLTSLAETRTVEHVNKRNWKSNDINWLIKNINSKTIHPKSYMLGTGFKFHLDMKNVNVTKFDNKSPPAKRRHIKQEVSPYLSLPSTSYVSNGYSNYRVKQNYSTDSESSDDENYIKILNEQVQNKRTELKLWRQQTAEKIANNVQEIISLYDEIIKKMASVYLQPKPIEFVDDQDTDFLGYSPMYQVNHANHTGDLREAQTTVQYNMEVDDGTISKSGNFNASTYNSKCTTAEYQRKFEIFGMNEAINQDPPPTVDDEFFKKKNLLLIARIPQGDFVGIKVADDRPEQFTSEMERIQWTGAKVRNLLRLKTDIESGSLSPKRPNVIQNPQLTIEERILAIEKCVVDRKQERLHWLQLESKLVEYDSEIKTYLGLEKADTEKALHCLEQIATLPIEQLMLTKHPHVVEMVRRLRRYIGNVKAWNLTPEQLSEFMKGAEKIRKKADEVYQKFKELYGLSPQDSFTEIYNSYVKEFNLKTKHMKEAQRFAVCAKPGTRQFEMDQMDDQLELEAIKLKNELENKKTRTQTIQDADMGGSTANT